MQAIFWTKHSHLTFSQFIDSVEGVLDEQQVVYLRQVDYNNQIAVENFEELIKNYQDQTECDAEKAGSEVESLREVVRRLTQLDLQTKREVVRRLTQLDLQTKREA